MQTVLEKISDFVLNTQFEDIPADVVDTAKLGLLDCMACAFAGSDAPVSKNILRYFEGGTPLEGSCVLIGTGRFAPLEQAALFNGAASHCMDFDDVSWATIGHPSVSVIGSCLACAQKGNWNGKGLIKAYVLAVEAMHQIARLTMPKLSEAGWHTTLAYGVFGAVVPAALLLGLTKGELVSAFGIAASRAGGLRANFGTQTKALHAGLSNRIGLDCALLSHAGVTASAKAIEGQDGFAQCFTAEKPHGKVNIGKYWDLRENGLVIKRYPCCSGSHPANDVWDEYLTQNPLNPEDIDHIYAGVSLLGPKELTCHQPEDAVQAKFSLEFAMAHRLIKGPLKLSSFKDEIVQGEAIQAFMKKIKMEVDPELAKLGFIGTAPIRLKIYMKDGSLIQLANDLAMGNPAKPLSDRLIKEKFYDSALCSLTKEKADEYLRILESLESAGAEQIRTLGLR